MKKYILTFLYILPSVAFAAPENLWDLVYLVRDFINVLVPLIFAVAVLLFLFGIVKFMLLHPDKPELREQGRQFMLWGIIAMFVMVSFWGLVNILTNTFFGIDASDHGNI